MWLRLTQVTSSLILVGSLILLTTVWSTDCDEARDAYQRGTKIKPGCYTPECPEGALQAKLAEYKRAVELCPTYPQAHNNLGVTLEELRRYPEAQLHYAEAVKLKPDYANAYVGLGDLLFRAGEYGRAAAEYDKALALNLKDDRTERRRQMARRLEGMAVPEATVILQELGSRTFATMDQSTVQREDEKRLLFPIPFARDRDTFLPKATEWLQHLCQALKKISEQEPTAAFLIEGHADEQGSQEHNRDLSIKRAHRVAEYVRGTCNIPSSQLESRGMGNMIPLAIGSRDAEREKNNRIEVIRLAGAFPFKAEVLYWGTSSQPQLLEDGMTLKEDAVYRISFRPVQHCYVYVYYVDSSDKAFRCYPSSGDGRLNAFVQAGEEHVLSSRNDECFKKNKPRGKNTVYVLAERDHPERIPQVFAPWKGMDVQEQTVPMTLSTSSIPEKLRSEGVDVIFIRSFNF